MPDLPTLNASVTPPFTGKGRVAGANVLAQLPAWLLKRVTTVKANDPQTVKLVTKDNETIVWGTAEDSELKADVLRILIKQKGMNWFDVRNPHLPTVSQQEPRPARQPKEKKDDEKADSESATPSPDAESSGVTSNPADISSQSPTSAPVPSRKPGEPYLLP